MLVPSNTVPSSSIKRCHSHLSSSAKKKNVSVFFQLTPTSLGVQIVKSLSYHSVFFNLFCNKRTVIKRCEMPLYQNTRQKGKKITNPSHREVDFPYNARHVSPQEAAFRNHLPEGRSNQNQCAKSQNTCGNYCRVPRFDPSDPVKQHRYALVKSPLHVPPEAGKSPPLHLGSCQSLCDKNTVPPP